MPGVLSSTDISEFRGLVADLAFPDNFTVERDTDVPDGAGGRTTTTATVASGDCRLRAGGLQGSERAVADRLGWQLAYAVDLHPDVAVLPSDRLVVNGRDLEIGAVIDIGAWAMVKTVVCREVGPT
jgi:hypothetical protein